MVRIHDEILNIGKQMRTLLHSILDSTPTSAAHCLYHQTPPPLPSSPSCSSSNDEPSPPTEPPQDQSSASPTTKEAANVLHTIAKVDTVRYAPEGWFMHGNAKYLNTGTKALGLLDSIYKDSRDPAPPVTNALTHRLQFYQTHHAVDPNPIRIKDSYRHLSSPGDRRQNGQPNRGMQGFNWKLRSSTRETPLQGHSGNSGRLTTDKR